MDIGQLRVGKGYCRSARELKENLTETELHIRVRTTDSIHISEIFQRKVRDSGRHGRRYNCRLKNLQYLDSRYLVCKIITEKFVQFNFVYLGK